MIDDSLTASFRLRHVFAKDLQIANRLPKKIVGISTVSHLYSSLVVKTPAVGFNLL
ncbi:MAG: hypothetical protein AB8B63_00665 [Granulosicoccus sp.]